MSGTFGEEDMKTLTLGALFDRIVALSVGGGWDLPVYVWDEETGTDLPMHPALILPDVDVDEDSSTAYIRIRSLGYYKNYDDKEPRK